METAIISLTQTEVLTWENLLANFRHMPEVISIHDKLILAKSCANFQSGSPEYLMQRIYLICGKTKSEIENKSRGGYDQSDTRAAISAILHDQFPMLSPRAIGWYTKRDRATVLHHYRMVEYSVDTRRVYEYIKYKLGI